MKARMKQNMLLLSLISMLAVTGCATKNIRKNSSQKVTLAEKKVLPCPLPEQKIAAKHPSVIQTGRYSGIAPIPTLAQRELLHVMITVTIPDQIRTVGETVRYLLKRSGYQLLRPKPEQTELAKFFNQQLPSIHRQLGPMILEDALKILTAPAFTLNVDPVKRHIGYKLNDSYARRIQ